jgi:phenylacetic acid degradation operon negative regulatory protein
MDPPELPVAQLVRLGGLFGISANRTRVALSRMVAAGEATTDGARRYRLSGHLQERQARQSASRSAITTPYVGQWWLAVVTTAGSTADVRLTRRQVLSFARLAELREGVWMRPDNLAVQLPGELEADVEIMAAQPADPLRLVGQLWDLGAWSDRADRLLEGLAALTPDDPGALAPGFGLSASVLRHLQADPLLPDELLPTPWPGRELRQVYDRWDARYRATLQVWSRA